MKKLLVLGFIVLAVFLMVQPAQAFLWPPIIGSCGLGGIFGPFGPCGPFNRCIPVPFAVPVPVPEPVPVPVCGPAPFCAPFDCGFGGPWGAGLGGWC